MKLYRLDYVQIIENNKNEIKVLGYFSNLSQEDNAIKVCKSLPGFSQNKGQFVKTEIYIDKFDSNVIYEAIFYIHDNYYEYEFSEILGIFGDKHQAKRKLDRYIKNNIALIEAYNYQLERIVNKHVINTLSNWKEGFIED